MSNYHSLRVREVIEETADTKSFIFDIPEDLKADFRYKPGQFLTLRIPHGGKRLPRCYSMSSAPELEEYPKVTVKRVADGRASNWLCDNVKVGDTLEVMAPAGAFHIKSLDGDFILFGGGSGITPVYSIAKTILAKGSGKVVLIYANRDENSVIFRDELKSLAAQHPRRLKIIHWLDSVQGIPSVAQLAELSRAWAHARAYICGPGPYMDAAVEALHEMEMPRANINVERFVSLPEEEGDGSAAQAAPAGGDESVIEVYIDGEKHEVRCNSEEPMLTAMLRAELKAPHSCLVGSCASCMCKLERGEVDLRKNDALDKNDLAEGWTLACQAYPKSERVVVRFPD
ncbi:MAG: ferredoxin--NADP reductase [Proteobacteria bacterium]|nr:ferredoxin--NADP reductase [Pseudomonadota bacterium]HQR02525.1 ferredoxin--NADP reductase [Rhodocyclaceae bacterium]